MAFLGFSTGSLGKFKKIQTPGKSYTFLIVLRSHIALVLILALVMVLVLVLIQVLVLVVKCTGTFMNNSWRFSGKLIGISRIVPRNVRN